ncbi:SRPBCC family protein [Frigoriflavimonas asaccharolytica]|uniref:Activator of Hsp90 ATPase homologue 1/2-like C-terminal domain-containing protein n=1 Tax=Frigoriflavimonas asaccharolytica TaxID=2735899 RepID=A0A8J8G8V0_9FLAO|nr:SRPBCC domain-containing protein [Frigoriflavimonas asaccharolytica]NRS91619.1 hypothetical protein [Frigoriflavimonas asaccharolytica]
MKKLEFTIEINASKEKIWEALWKAENYAEWTRAFCEGSHIKGDLVAGNTIQFLDANNDGMFAIVTEMIPNEKMYFTHLGEVKAGESGDKIYEDESIENYDIVENDGKSDLTITINAPVEYLQFFTNYFPTAVQNIKNIAER